MKYASVRDSCPWKVLRIPLESGLAWYSGSTSSEARFVQAQQEDLVDLYFFAQLVEHLWQCIGSLSSTLVSSVIRKGYTKWTNFS